MTSLLYLDRLSIPRRRGALLFAGFFIITESSVFLFLSDYRTIPYVVSLISACLVAFMVGRVSMIGRCTFQSPPIIDLFVYAGFAVATFYLSSAIHVASPIGSGVVGRVDLELYALAVLVSTAAIVCPCCGDVYLKKIGLLKENRMLKFSTQVSTDETVRHLEYQNEVAFGIRRCITSVAALIWLASGTWVCLLFSPGLPSSIAMVTGFGLLSPWVFDQAYGYRSYIMRFFGSSLFLTVASVLFLKTEYSRAVPSGMLTFLAYALASTWVVFWIFATTQIWRNTNRKLLITAQVFSHTLFSLVLGAGHLIVYVGWILPLVQGHV